MIDKKSDCIISYQVTIAGFDLDLVELYQQKQPWTTNSDKHSFLRNLFF